MTSLLPQKSTAFLNLVFTVLFGFAGPASALLPDEQNNIDVYKSCSPAVVNITATTLRQDFFFQVYPQKGLGSGVIIRNDGIILTNYHVIGEQAVEVEVTLTDKSSFPAKVLGRDRDSDLAVIKIDAKGKKLVALDMAAWETLAVGQKTLAIGNPFGLGGSLTVGTVSSLGRDIRASNDSAVIKDVIQTDAAINPGNSGGPLLDSSGKIIGINAQIYSQSGGSEGIGFAISVNTLKRVVPQLIEFGKVSRPWLGVEGLGLPGAILNRLGVPAESGVMLVGVYRSSPAALAGLKPATGEARFGYRALPVGGDVITQLDNTPVTTVRDIADYINDKKKGDKVVVHYYRAKQKKTATVTLTYPPNLNAQSL